MPKKYTLIYFNRGGRAEVARLIFAYKNVDYEDKRISDGEWKNIKTQMPCQQLPVLVVDGGEKLAQSVAIARYLGNEFGLVGKTNWENAQLDQAVGCVEDLMLEALPWFMADDEAKKPQIEQALQKTMPVKLRILECCAKLDKGNRFILGDEPTWADFFAASILDIHNNVIFHGTLKQININLDNYRARVMSLPGVKEWLEKRPKTTI